MPNLSHATSRNAFKLVDTDFPEGVQEQVFEATVIEVSGVETKVYPIGAGCWT